MGLLNWFMRFFNKKKAVADDLAVKIERRLDDRTLWAEITKDTEEIKTDAAIIGDSIHHISIPPEVWRKNEILRELQAPKSFDLLKREIACETFQGENYFRQQMFINSQISKQENNTNEIYQQLPMNKISLEDIKK